MGGEQRAYSERSQIRTQTNKPFAPIVGISFSSSRFCTSANERRGDLGEREEDSSCAKDQSLESILGTLALMMESCP